MTAVTYSSRSKKLDLIPTVVATFSHAVEEGVDVESANAVVHLTEQNVPLMPHLLPLNIATNNNAELLYTAFGTDLTRMTGETIDTRRKAGVQQAVCSESIL